MNSDEEGELCPAGPLTSCGTLLFVCVLPTQCPASGQPEVIQLELPALGTVRSLRLLAWAKAASESARPGSYQPCGPDSFQLLYRKGPAWYEMLDDEEILLALGAVRYWQSLGHQRGHIYLRPNSRDTEAGRLLWDTVASLIGRDVRALVNGQRQGELNTARRRFAAVRRANLGRRHSAEPRLNSSPLPAALQAVATQEIGVTIYRGGSSQRLKVCGRHTPELVIRAYGRQTGEELGEELALRVCGREEYLIGNWSLVDFCWVRRCLKMREELRLALVSAPGPEPDQEQEVARDWPLVEEDSGPSLGEGEEARAAALPLSDCRHPFRVKLLGLDAPGTPGKRPVRVYVVGAVMHGSLTLCSARSIARPLAEEVLWNAWLRFDIQVRDLPRGSRLGLRVYALENSPPSDAGDGNGEAGLLLYHASLLLIDHHRRLQQGQRVLHLWPGSGHGAGLLSSATNPDLQGSAALCLLLDSYDRSVVLSSEEEEEGEMEEAAARQRAAFRRFTQECGRYSRSLPAFLATVRWAEQRAVRDLHRLIRHWDPGELELPVALELLGERVADERVRELAVRRLEQLAGGTVLRLLLQLVQALKFEPYHDSSLARFLIGWALRSKRIGHFFFWYCRGEVAASPHFADRYAVILEAYLLGCSGPTLRDLEHQVRLVTALGQVAGQVKAAIAQRSDIPQTAAPLLQELLRTAELPQDFVTPYDPHIRAGHILVDRCRVLASKQKPLWLEFSRADPETPAQTPVVIIFKHGDDLRQDMLILQTLVIMDSIWQENALDLNLIPYGCIATGYNMGMIEAVRDAATIAAVQRMKGGNSGAFKNDALHDWLKDKLPVEEDYHRAMETFVTSCAGYCVATYVLGIGDRHNDNIMITEKGNLFHIDFGHILGNRKQILGVNRERVPFVLTPDFLYVMGRVNRRPSLYFQRFKETCLQAYMSLWTHSQLLINLFSLMLLTGIPELSCTRDIGYLREALAVGSGEQEARQHFLNQISICENLGWTVQANWWIHMFMGIKQA
ncbi:phosphatidylinositol 4,5-bisphosphate 3-kinase catalytic subunit gamma isoform-like [Hypanus sabinus]|uniref:phosphatidylinositol 4,5-bisphosphate 3-kinase catalytic subunit gamma isoform-like n=1 Tax=Hypanus sabinus TaxID=79690 RepID=UPI0028C43068|nr:phosphatidylinositol 4,5-bisphosphate 3-kinase catalytic subunit gamma isoform-like [Hypanus sabinus]XP_059799890.1 phosphatidylinositol 4,5-bisphosphate 3-kinase catalytic subunit gamma isoform-like [Hypanus sabinus]